MFAASGTIIFSNEPASDGVLLPDRKNACRPRFADWWDAPILTPSLAAGAELSLRS
jgi:hypothetical protein